MSEEIPGPWTGVRFRSRIGPVCLLLFAAACNGGTEPATERSAAPPAAPVGASVADEPRTAVAPQGLLPRFRTIGPESGLDFERNDDIHGLHRIIESNGGGVALFDFERDGRLDVFLTNGCQLPVSGGDRSSPSALFQNRGEWRFAPVTQPSRIDQFGYACGCTVGDYDADGFEDLYVTALGRNTLWRNNGDGTFVDATGSSGTAVPVWSSSAAFADLDLDGHPDLYVVNYLDESDESPTLCPHPEAPDGYVACAPARFRGVDDVLFLADGAGGFRDVTPESGVAGLRGKGLGVVTCDLDGDSVPEVYVANDGEANFLFVGSAPRGQDAGFPEETPLRYGERALLSGVALNEAGYAEASMGIAAGDFDGDGAPDLFLTNFIDETNTLYANRGGLRFEESTRQSRLTASRHVLGFGTVFLDADNDGWLDLFVANGHVDDRRWRGEPYRMPPQMYRNEGDGTFADVSRFSGDYFEKEWLGRGVAAGDLDRDGRIDLAVSHQLAPSVLLRNETPTDNAAIILLLIGTASARDGVGARVELPGAGVTIVRELCGGGSYQSASAAEIHLGLPPGMGDRDGEAATVVVTWPSGRVDTHERVTGGRYGVREGGGVVPLP